MLTAFTNEATTWLGYLQRGSVLIQLALFVVAVAAETRLKRRLQSPLLSSASYLVTPLLVLVVSSLLLALRIPAGLLRYFSLLWLIWRAVEPSKLLLQKRFPKAPLDEIDKTFFRPVLFVVSVLTFFQMLGSRESLSLISLGDVFGVTLTVGKLVTAIVAT